MTRVLLATGTLLIVCLALTQGQMVVRGPYLQRGTPTSIVVSGFRP